MNAEELGLTEQQFEAFRSKVKELREALDAYKKNPTEARKVVMWMVATELKDISIEVVNGSTILLDDIGA